MGGLNDEVKLHLVDWDTICSPISEGGLGIRNVRKFNQALLGKWLWRYAHEEEAWWKSVLVAKYGSMWGGWRSCVINKAHGIGFGSIFVWGGTILRGILDLTLGLALRLGFKRMFGVGRALSKTLFRVCLTLPVSRRRLLRIMWNVPMAPSSGTLSSLV